MVFSNGSEIYVDDSISHLYSEKAGLFEDMLASIEPPLVAVLRIIPAKGSTISVEIERSGPNHCSITIQMGTEWDDSSPGEFIRSARAIAGYLFSTKSKHDVLHWMDYIDKKNDHEKYISSSF